MTIQSKIYSLAIGSLICAVSASAHAQDASVPFTGVVVESCSLLVGAPGTLGLSGDQTILSSTEGGVKGTVVATTNGIGSTIQVITPSAFTSGPASADTDVSFSTAYDLSGQTLLSEVLGDTLSPLGLGVTTVSVDATATKSAGTFDSGTYILTPVVRCTSS